MTRKERQPKIVDEETLDPEDEKYWDLREQGYNDLDYAERHARDLLSRDLDTTKSWLKAYYFGKRFAHVEAYMLCGVGRTWPDFCFHPTEKNYVLKFEQLNSATGKDSTHQNFEAWVDENRREIARRAALSLSISWIEIENS